MSSHPLVDLAIQPVKHHLENGQSLPCPNPLPENMQKQARALPLSRRARSPKKSRSPRGCIGTIQPKYANLAIQPKYANLAEGVTQNAIKVASEKDWNNFTTHLKCTAWPFSGDRTRKTRGVRVCCKLKRKNCQKIIHLLCNFGLEDLGKGNILKV